MSHERRGRRRILIYLEEAEYQKVQALLRRVRGRYDPDRSLSSFCRYLLMRAVESAEVSSEYGPGLPHLQVQPIEEHGGEPSKDQGAHELEREQTSRESLRHLQELKKQWPSLADAQREKHLRNLKKYLESPDPDVRAAAAEVRQLSQNHGA